MKSENDWVWLISGLAAGTLLGILLYPRVIKSIRGESSDPRVKRVKLLLDEADELIRRLKNADAPVSNM